MAPHVTPLGYWTEREPYPRPRPRSIEERIAAGLLTQEEAVRQLQQVQFGIRQYVFFIAVSNAGWARAVSPRFAGLGLIKHITFIPRFDIGNPTSLKVFIGPDGSGEQAQNAGTPDVNPSDQQIWDGSVVSTTAAVPATDSLAATGQGTYQGEFVLRLNHVVHLSDWHLKITADNSQLGTIELSGHALVFEGIPAEQLAMALAA